MATTAECGRFTPMQWTFREILTAMGGRAAAQVPDTARFSSISTDSRQTEPGALFFALRGPRHDGHDFVAEALRRGALGAVVQRDLAGVAAGTLIRVPETLTALGDLAAWTRRQHVPTVVGITGSNGKTTTKDMVAAICDAGRPGRGKIGVLKTEGNLNNLVGLPLTLLGARGDEWVAVLEMGMNRPGEIARLTEITRPDYAIVTNVARAHLQGVGGTVAGVAAAKGELVAGLSHRAVIAVNVDDAWVRRLCMLFPGRRITFGHNADVQARHVVELGADGVAFELVIGRQAVRVRLRLVGAHNVTNALGAAAIGHALGLDGAVIARGLERVIGPAMRMQAERLPNGVTLINDAYNANPSSVEAALVALRRFSGRPVVVLGEMRELGDESRRAHRAIGERAATLGVAQLFLLGVQAEAVAEGARAGGLRAGAIHVCGSHAEVAAALTASWQPGDTVLVKGSRSMKMEEVVRLLEGAGSAP